MKKLSNILIFTALLGAMGCNQSPQATIEGHITEAADKMLYLDHIGVERTSVVDSAKLDKDGSFRFRVPGAVDGKWHTVSIAVTPGKIAFTFDGKVQNRLNPLRPLP